MDLGSFQLALAQEAAEPDRATSAGRALFLFIGVAAGLAVLFAVLAVMALSQRRHARTRNDPRTLTLDAWKTAGERVEPMDGAGKTPTE